jgi:hypothetical protein
LYGFNEIEFGTLGEGLFGISFNFRRRLSKDFGSAFEIVGLLEWFSKDFSVDFSEDLSRNWFWCLQGDDSIRKERLMLGSMFF